MLANEVVGKKTRPAREVTVVVAYVALSWFGVGVRSTYSGNWKLASVVPPGRTSNFSVYLLLGAWGRDF